MASTVSGNEGAANGSVSGSGGGGGGERPSKFFDPSHPRVYAAGITHPGVEHRQNQDAFFVWKDVAAGHIVTGVLDGHGRELGQAAAYAARDCFESRIPSLSAENFRAFRADPVATFQQLFDAAHMAIRDAFIQSLEAQGFATKWENNTLLKAPRGSGEGAEVRWQSVSGGTTCTVLVILDAKTLYVANVGDSDCLLCSTPGNPSEPEQTARPLEVYDVSAFAAGRGGGVAGASGAPSNAAPPSGSGDGVPVLPQPVESTQIDQAVPMGGGGAAAAGGDGSHEDLPPPKKLSRSKPLATKPGVHYVECTAEHSAESLREFKRMRRFRPSPDNNHEPELRFLFDAFGYMKHSRPAVFRQCDGQPGEFVNTRKGVYHKNVRAEFASLVCTPAHAPFQDGLAFTRSLGDFYLHTFGVSSIVDVQCADLGVISQAGTDGCLAICLASDGVWDNWKFPDIVNEIVSRHFLQGITKAESESSKPSSPSHACSGETAAERNAQRLMRLNHARATSNFGSSMDNMTLVLVYMIPPPLTSETSDVPVSLE